MERRGEDKNILENTIIVTIIVNMMDNFGGEFLVAWSIRCCVSS